MDNVSLKVGDILSLFGDPRYEERTEAERPVWEAYVEVVNAANKDYEEAELKAREYYITSRRRYLKGSIFQPSWRAMFYPHPTDAMVEEFEKCESTYIKEYENAVFLAARAYFRAETKARANYQTATRKIAQSG